MPATELDVEDYAGSWALLIGISSYRDQQFPRLPAARNSLNGMREILTDEQLCGWPPERVDALHDETDSRRLITTLRQRARETTDVLLLYYVGHGTTAPDGELCLTLSDTAWDDPDITGLEYRHVRSALIGSPARVKIVILDCCFSGRAIQALSGPAQFAGIRGTFVIAAADQAAHVPPPDEQDLACTSFTGELLELIRTGVEDGPGVLTLDLIYARLRAQLRDGRLPDPNRHASDTAGDFGFARNAAYLPGPIERFPRPKPSPPRRPWRTWGVVATTAVLLAVAGVYGGTRLAARGAAPCGASAPAMVAATPGDPIEIGSGDFTESELIAAIYVDALDAKGMNAHLQAGFSAREVYYPEVCSGQLTIVPEYNGSLLTTSVDPGSTVGSTSQVDTALAEDLPPTLAILAPAPAQDRDSVTVTAETAARYHLKALGDLRRVAPRMMLGGEPEFYGREQGRVGLEKVYGVSFRSFQSLNYAGGQSGCPADAPVQALMDKQVQAADVFTTDPCIKADDLVSLADPENLFGVDNVVPLAYKPALTANPHLEATLDAVSARLTQSALLALDTEVTQQHVSVQEAARRWLAASHLG